MAGLIHRVLTRLFPLEEINGRHRCPTYLYRWKLFRLFGCAVYLHRFVGDDWSLDLHDHPKRFLSVGLCGSYVEHTRRGSRRFIAPWVRSFPGTHAHRITVDPNGECWTLVAVFRASRPWGFWHSGVWIHWKEYVLGRSAHLADARTSCEGL